MYEAALFLAGMNATAAWYGLVIRQWIRASTNLIAMAACLVAAFGMAG